MAIYTVAAIIAGILAVGAVVAMFIFVLPKKKDGKLPKALQILHDIAHFKKFYIGDFLKAMYILVTAFCIVYGFILLFGFESGYSWYRGEYFTSTFGTGILIMLLGPIATRIVYEVSIMGVNLVQNVADINNKLKNQNKVETPAEPVVEQPQTPVAPAQNNYYNTPYNQ